jgi:site-specific DNA-cytosine methylase|tara:strand:+ start:8070 stop:9257 length:1188 start_codon:yes stop_codon:yes gene_type:complete
MSYASIVPLIGGETIAMENVFGEKPKYFLTFEGFQANESHINNHYNHEVPYLNLSEGASYTEKVDVINTVCPCAGLSSLSPSASSTNPMNEWMYKSAEYVLGEVQPKVFWGENAPRLASKMGEPVVKRLRKIGEEHGYTFSIFKTKSILHGLSQVRDRTFYFFWKGDEVPLLEYIHVNGQSIADDIRDVKRCDNDPMSQILCNDAKPSDNPYYRYVLEVLEGGITHKEFQDKIEKTTNPMDYIEERTTYKEVAVWMRENGYDNVAKKCDRQYHKLKSGGNIMRKTTEIPKDKIGAFVGHMPTCLTHPDEDRYLTVREALSLMKLPFDFILLDPKRSLNHICQNVPVTTAEHPARMVQKYLNNQLEMVDTKFLVQDNKKRTYEFEKNSLQLTDFMV